MSSWLDTALDCGLTEFDFWEMTIAELERVFRSKARQDKARAQEQASHNYILADLIGKSIGRIYSSANKMPTISEVYPSLFDSEEVKQEIINKKAEISALRFKLFADSHNKKFNEGVKSNNE